MKWFRNADEYIAEIGFVEIRLFEQDVYVFTISEAFAGGNVVIVDVDNLCVRGGVICVNK